MSFADDCDRYWSRLFLPPDDSWSPADDVHYGYLTGAAGTLSAETVRKAMDEMLNPRVPLPPPGYLGSRKPFGSVPFEVTDPEWTVQADGWKLIIRDGAMVGLEAWEF